jgi:hypothetical protein
MHQVKAPDIACQLQRITAIDGRLWLHLLSYPAIKAKDKQEHLSVQSHYCLYIQFEIAIFF